MLRGLSRSRCVTKWIMGNYQENDTVGGGILL
jgi:hypothetical protein